MAGGAPGRASCARGMVLGGRTGASSSTPLGDYRSAVDDRLASTGQHGGVPLPSSQPATRSATPATLLSPPHSGASEGEVRRFKIFCWRKTS